MCTQEAPLPKSGAEQHQDGELLLEEVIPGLSLENKQVFSRQRRGEGVRRDFQT